MSGSYKLFASGVTLPYTLPNMVQDAIFVMKSCNITGNGSTDGWNNSDKSIMGSSSASIVYDSATKTIRCNASFTAWHSGHNGTAAITSCTVSGDVYAIF